MEAPFTWFRGARASFNLDRRKGVYALFLRGRSSIGAVRAGKDGLIYIGKASGKDGFIGRCHFNGPTVTHSPRKSLAVLLMAELNLVAISKPSGKWGLEKSSDRRLSDWMHQHLDLAFEVCASPAQRERQLVAKHEPPLNLTICFQTDQHRFISRERSRIGAIKTPSGYKVPTLTANKSARTRLAQVAETKLVTANMLADMFGLDQKSFRATLRQKVTWYRKPKAWAVPYGSQQHHDMLAIAKGMSRPT